MSGTLNAQGNYVEVNDIKMYYEIHGEGEPLLLLHGGTGAIEHFNFQIPDFSKSFRVIIPESRGHARTTDSDKPLTYELMASDMAELLKYLQVDSLSVFGWSDGGIIGLHLAISHPQKIKKLIVMGTNYRADGLVPDFVERLKIMTHETAWRGAIDRYKKYSSTPQNWPTFFEKLKKMWLNLPNFSEDDLGKISQPTLVIVGDHDIIQLDHTVELFQSIPKAQLCVIPKTTHAVLLEKPELVDKIILDFLNEEDTRMN